jgi:hypothetical protein
MSTVAHPLGSRIIARLPKLHIQVIGKSFGHLYAEGIYLCSDDKTPAVHMYDMMSRKIMILSDFIVYPYQFSFHSLHCLVYPSYTAAEIAKMHMQDIADDAAVSAEQQTQAFTRSQTRALEAAQLAAPQQFSPAVLAPDPTIYTRSIPSPTLDEVVSFLPAPLTLAPQEIHVKRIPVNTTGGLPPLDSKLDELTEDDIVRTMARHNFTFALPLDYRPPALPTPLGVMIVTVKSAVKLGKKSDAKSARLMHPRRSIDDDDDISTPEGYTGYTPDPSHCGQAMRQRLRSQWLAAEDLEMAGLMKRKVWDRELRSTLLPSDTIFQTRFHYKIKRKGGKFEKCKVRLVVQGDRMTKKDESGIGDFEDGFSSVPHASGLRFLLAITTKHNMHTDHVDISQAFTQGELLDGDVQNGKVYICAPPGYPEDPAYCYLLKRSLCGMPSAARVWFTTMSEFLKTEGCSKVGYEVSMWQVTQNGHNIVLAAHIDDLNIACAHRPTLDSFRSRLLEVFDGTYEGGIHTNLGCEITCDLEHDITTLSQKHYAEEILHSDGSWDTVPCSTVLPR